MSQRLLLLGLVLFNIVTSTIAQEKSGSVFNEWSQARYQNPGVRYAWPDHFRAFNVDMAALADKLKAAPSEFALPIQQSNVVLNLPMPDGTNSAFRIVETEVMHPVLAAAYPTIKTYTGQGVEHADEIVRLSITEHGLHVMVLSPRGDVYMDPLNQGDRINHIVYYKGDFRPNRPFECSTDDQELYKEIKQKLKSGGAGGSVLRTHGTQLRNYRIAMAATGEYTAFHGGTKSSALAAIVVSMNRVNGIYEKEVAVRMTLIPNDTLIIYTNGSTDPYTNNNGSTMLGENITNCNSVIGSANFDIGHVFSTGGGGVAYLGVPCTSNKAGGVTGSGSPVGDAFDVDYVAHEIGHQFGGQHTFNSATGSCSGGNRSAGSAYEPGSGITIMAYAGICGADNLAPNSIAYFHTHSFDQIVNYITTGSGNTCPTTTANGNTPPTATPAGLAYTIPFQTPFELNATGSDANGDAITYSWEEYDLGAAGTWNAPSGNAPLFRPFPPVSTGSRTFPKLSDILANTTTIGELLPSYARSMFFRVTVRDNRVGGGGVMHIDDTVKVTVINTTTPFRVTAPNTAVTWFSGSTTTVTWDVSSTNLSPINCANVAIELSTNGGNTFPITLLATTPNDGSETISVPANLTTQARVRIRAVGNIFFDISNTNFTIQSGSGVLTVLNTNALASSNLCAGQTLSVGFSGDGSANSGNTYTAQLSSSAGSFTSPVTIGTLSSTASSGAISCTIPAGTAQGTGYRIRVIASNPAITGSNNGTNLSIFQTIGSTGVISGSASVCQGQGSIVYSVPAVSNATTYAWTLPTGFSITANSGTNSITVSTSASAVSGSITVTPSNPCSTGAASTAYTVTVNPLPGAAGVITGPANPCPGSTGNVYSVGPISNASTYTWTLPSGASITSGSGTNSITVTFGSAGGSLGVAGTNSCGSGSSSSLSVNIQSAPVVPVIAVSPAASACIPDSITLTVPAQAGTNFQWRRNGVNITGATGTSYKAWQSGSYDVVATFTSVGAQSFSSTTSAAIPDNSCTGSSTSVVVSGYNNPVRSSGIFVKINSLTHTWVGDLDLFLETPSGVKLGLSDQTGNANNSGDNFTNTVFADSGSVILPTTGAPYTSLYKPWNAAFTVTGCTGVTTGITTFNSIGNGSVNPNGTWKLWAYDRASTDTGRIVSWTISFPFQSYTCSQTAVPVTLTFNSAPSVPVIIGTDSVCVGSTAVVYTVSSQAGVNYSWTVPTGVTITGGQGTNSITTTWSSSAVSGNVGVILSNACGNRTATLGVLVETAPTGPTVSGSATVCKGQSGVVYSTTIQAGVNYTWTVPSGVTITSGQGTNSISTTWGATSVSGNVLVTLSSACGTTSGSRIVTVNATPTISSFSPSSGTPGTTIIVNGSGFTGVTAVAFNGTPAAAFSVISTSQLSAVVPTGAALGKIGVTNSCGTVLSTNNFLPINNLTLQVTALIEGLRVSGGNMVPQLSSTQSDSITVQLRQSVSPFNIVFTGTGIMNLSGQVSLSLPAALNGSSVYIVVRHRNSLETWSKLPVSLSSFTSYNFKQ